MPRLEIIIFYFIPWSEISEKFHCFFSSNSICWSITASLRLNDRWCSIKYVFLKNRKVHKKTTLSVSLFPVNFLHFLMTITFFTEHLRTTASELIGFHLHFIRVLNFSTWENIYSFSKIARIVIMLAQMLSKSMKKTAEQLTYFWRVLKILSSLFAEVGSNVPRCSVEKYF